MIILANIHIMSGKKNFLPEKINSSKGNYTIDGTRCSLRNSVSAMPFPFLAFVAFGTRNALLRYGIDTRCQKRHPTVRDAFSEALRAQNRLLGYGREIRYQKHPPTVRGAVRPPPTVRGAVHSEARCTGNHLLVYGMKRSDATVV